MKKRNKRLHRRARVLLPVTVRLDGKDPIEAVVTDVSVGGLFVLDDARLARAKRAEIDLELDQQRVRASARVVRLQRPRRARGLDVPGLGLAFVELPSPAARAIASLVAARAV